MTSPSSSEFDADDFMAAGALLSLRPNPVLKLLPVWPSYKKKKRAETHNKNKETSSTEFETTRSNPQIPLIGRDGEHHDVITPPPPLPFPMSEQRSVIAVPPDSKFDNQSESMPEAQMRYQVLMRSNAIFKEVQSRKEQHRLTVVGPTPLTAVYPNPSHLLHRNQRAAESRAARKRRAEVMRGKSLNTRKIQRLR